MDILFTGSKLEKDCCSLERARQRWGEQCGKKVLLRLQQFHAAPNLEAIRLLPQARCHELHGDRSGQLAVDLQHPFRLVFEPADDPRPSNQDGGLDWTRVTQIRVLEVVNYHD